MAKSEVVSSKTKDNSSKHPTERREWQDRKRAGRPKQVWVADLNADGWEEPTGHWAKA